jgi:hypothetical protein
MREKDKKKRKKIVRDLFDEAVTLRSGQSLPRAPQVEQIFSSQLSTPKCCIYSSMCGKKVKKYEFIMIEMVEY